MMVLKSGALAAVLVLVLALHQTSSAATTEQPVDEQDATGALSLNECCCWHQVLLAPAVPRNRCDLPPCRNWRKGRAALSVVVSPLPASLLQRLPGGRVVVGCSPV